MRSTAQPICGLLCLLGLFAGDADAAGDDGHFLSAQGLHHYRDDQPRWSALRRRHTHAAVTAGELILLGSSAGLYAFDRRGRQRWWLDLGGTVYSPLVQGDWLWAGSESGRLLGLSRDDGGIRWQRDFPGWVYSPARSGDLIATGGSQARLWALEARSGALRWSLDLGAELVNSPTASTGTFYATTFAAELLAIDAASGKVRWRRRLPSAATTPLPLDDQLLLRLFDGSLLAVSAGDGEPRWHHRSRGRAHSPATPLSGGRLLLDEGAGLLSLLCARDGRVLARASYRGALVGQPRWREGAALIHLRGPPGSAPLALRLPLQSPLVSAEE